MYPYILPEVIGYTLATYDVLLIFGVFLMMLYISMRFDRQGYSKKQTNKLLILIIVSLLSALVWSYLLDGLFHYIKDGELEFGSLNFLSGLVGGFVTFYLLMKYYYKEEKNMREIVNTIVVGVVLAHAIGRIGCFFAGCCFGIPTESALGVIFPHGHADDLYGDAAVYPTQLFEAFFLFVLFGLLHFMDQVKGKEMEVYLIGYGIWRLLLEFIRGDNRGALFSWYSTQYNVFPTPAQFISLLLIILGVVLLTLKNKNTMKDVTL